MLVVRRDSLLAGAQSGPLYRFDSLRMYTTLCELYVRFVIGGGCDELCSTLCVREHRLTDSNELVRVRSRAYVLANTRNVLFCVRFVSRLPCLCM